MLLFEIISSKYCAYVIQGSRTIAAEENCAPTLILTLTLDQNLILTGGQISSGAILCTPYLRSIQKEISNWYDIKKVGELHCEPIDMVFTWQHFSTQTIIQTHCISLTVLFKICV